MTCGSRGRGVALEVSMVAVDGPRAAWPAARPLDETMQAAITAARLATRRQSIPIMEDFRVDSVVS